MSRLPVFFTRRAQADLVSISQYIARDDEGTARRLVDEIGRTCKLLENSPMRGRPGHVSGTRELVLSKAYIAVYRVAGDQIDILTVRHTARLWPGAFEDNDVG
ncbi:MAG: type II toxin-antitoxin system RelE/ParE family toxin [Pseudomonadota bacterium]